MASISFRQHNRVAEFDDYASDYDAGMENGLKRLVGESAEQFMDVKVCWLLNHLARKPLTGRQRLLDYGCGTGLFLQQLHSHGFTGELHGCDISERMLAEGARKYDVRFRPLLQHFGPPRFPYPDRSFALVVVCAVLHHVPADQRWAIYAEAQRVLVSGGRIYVFEHNPLNPITQWVVRHTSIDRNAVLVRRREVTGAIRDAGFAVVGAEPLMFFPPRWRTLVRCERALRWLPMGGQYVVVGEKR